ncbi:hypothetical protein M407DRAFT_221873, partial [Tulasnella calospora MUT 4182]
NLENAELRAERRQLLACLGDGSYGARGTSIEDAVCLHGTRVETLERIDRWIKDTSDSAERVLWIRGMAGRGKSTIASTVAHRWASKGSCAIFHFRRGQNALDGQFICALARQLGKSLVPEVKNAILHCVKENEDIAKERLDQQFKTLFVGSLEKLRGHAHPTIIIVDALDECKNVMDTVRFVRLIDEHSSFLPTRVKFLLTCRPEAPLLVALESRKWRAEDLDSIPRVDEDITRFIQNACAQIRDDHHLPETWPSLTEVKGIVEMSQGLFQWARTAVTYISGGSPDHRLQDLLQHSSKWSGLDDLYHQILSKAFNEVEKDSMRRELLSWVLGTLIVAPYPMSLEVIAFLHADHAIFKGQKNIVQFLRKDILADLNSLLHIPTSSSEPVRLMHTSIRDLLTARERCESQCYLIDPMEVHRRLAGVSLQVMARDLKQNICNLPDISMANSEIKDSIDDHISKGLRYCCRFWSTHLTAGITWSETAATTTSLILTKFRVVSEDKLLSWLEVMSLIGAMTEAGSAAKQVYQWLLVSTECRIVLSSPCGTTSRDLLLHFSSRCCSVRSTSTLQPSLTPLWGQGDPLTGHSRYISSVAFSPDSKILASGSGDKTIRFWDVRTQTPLGDPLTGHNKWISSIDFSSDGKILATGSPDNTVRLWDAQTGVPLGDPSPSHSSMVASTASLPGNTALASSYDNAVWSWDPQTGTPLGDPLSVHGGPIISVIFSPDSRALASGSSDNTVRLWDVHAGAPLGEPLTGHNGNIKSVIFSPDGKVLASVSDDNTVRLWDVQTRAPLGNPLTGHSDEIESAVFSSDGKVLASGSSDETVRLWDVQTGASLGKPLTGHTSWVETVAFSPDGKILASGSGDNTVRLWAVETGALLGEPLTGHRNSINSVTFSPDGKVVASGSHDNTVRLWDALTGTPLGDPLTGHGSNIRSFIFSQDGKVLISGSNDNTVQLWEVQTGAPLGDPLSGHSGAIESALFQQSGEALISRSAVQLWDPPTYRVCDGLLSNLSSQPVRVRSNWVIWNSKRLMWLPAHYRSQYSHGRISSLGSIALVSGALLSILDVSDSLKL